MSSMTIPQNEKAAGRAATTATTTIHPEVYRPPTALSSSKPDGTALGMLLLGLQKPGLPPFVRRYGYGLAEAWAKQFVEARHPEVA